VFPIADRILVLEKSRVLLFDEPRKVGEKLKNIGNNGVAKGLPSAIRIYQGLQNNSVCPLTVKEGRECLAKNYTNKIRTLKRERGAHRLPNRQLN